MPAPRPWYDRPDRTESQILALLARGYDCTAVGRRMHLTRTGVQARLRTLTKLWRLRRVRQLLMLAGAQGWVAFADHAPRSRAGVLTHLGRITPYDRHPWKGAA